MKVKYLIALLCLLTAFTACREDEPNLPSEGEGTGDTSDGEIKGFFLLNEGNMGSNSASLDYYSYETGTYHRNIFPERNPGIALGMGDVGNDLKIYGHKLYAVINCSNMVTMMDLRTGRSLGDISVVNCRYMAFDGPYAYVTSYAGPVVENDPESRRGYVARIDTATLKVVGQCSVGYQPEEMAVVGRKMYVANSGGYRAPDYDNTVSVIDLDTFTETHRIEAGINLHRLRSDRYGKIYVSSRGDHYTIPSRTYVIDTDTDEVAQTLNLLPCTNLASKGDSLYVYSSEYNYNTDRWTIGYAIYNTSTESVVTRNVLRDGMEAKIKVPYGIAVNPESGDILVTDAVDYVTPGKLYCFHPDGTLKWSVTTGDIPSSIAFTTVGLTPLDKLDKTN